MAYFNQALSIYPSPISTPNTTQHNHPEQKLDSFTQRQIVSFNSKLLGKLFRQYIQASVHSITSTIQMSPNDTITL